MGVVQESVRHVAQSLHTNPKYARGVSLTELRISTWRCYSPGAQLDCLQVLIACLQDKLALLLPRPPLQDAELAADWAVFAASQPRDSSHLCFARHHRGVGRLEQAEKRVRCTRETRRWSRVCGLPERGSTHTFRSEV